MAHRFIEKGEFKGRVLSKICVLKMVDSRKLIISALMSSFIFVASINSDVHALGVGAAEAESFIGEQLSVRIPLFNVDDPNSLSVSFESEQFNENGQVKVNAVLDRSNSQLSIKISSDSIVHEPYVNFKLDLVDNETEFSKEFTVLMDLPAQRNTDFVSPLEQAAVTSSQVISSNQLASDFNGSESLMGPYDTAQAGRIPKKFGAVLDGQSLWRVARRINEAMGVSKSQMIWSLYQANPDAFTSRSVSSLKAGTFLTIPDESIVKSVSDSQAKANLSALRANSQQLSTAAAPKSSNEEQDFGLTENIQSEGQEQSPPFQVTGIDEPGIEMAVSTDQQSQKVIESLTETVGNLSQQLFRKDQKIEFLEQQVVELKSFINAGSSSEAGVAPLVDSDFSSFESLPDTITDDEATTTENTTISETAVANTPVIAQERPESEAVTPVAPIIANTDNLAKNQESSSWSLPLWQWALIGIFSLCLIAFFLRNRLFSLFESLNLFGSDEEVEFASVAVDESTHKYARAQAEPSLDTSNDLTQSAAEKDYSILSAVESSMADKDVLDGISYLDLADDGSYEENEVLEFETEDVAVEEVEDLSFDERFERLLAESDFEFARELLEFARHNEINDQRYHCERLRILEKMKDEDAFYDYYYEIESEIPSYPQNLQTQISQLVVQLAQH